MLVLSLPPIHHPSQAPAALHPRQAQLHYPQLLPPAGMRGELLLNSNRSQGDIFEVSGMLGVFGGSDRQPPSIIFLFLLLLYEH